MTKQPAIRVIMMPRDINPNQTIFGGVLLSYIDQAGYIGAQEHTKENIVTVAMNEIIFKQPVFVGDVVSFYTTLVKIGTTSITIRVDVEALRIKSSDPLFVPTREPIPVTTATLVFVAVNEQREAIPVGD